MKYLIYLILVISSASCQSLSGIEKQSSCPDNYECFTEVEKNKSIKAFQDTTNRTYLRLESSKDSSVIKYILRYKDNAMIADDEYVEIIHLQIPNNFKKLDLKDAELSNLNAYLQKSCYCIDGGYEQIQKGTLKLRKKDGHVIVNFDFDVTMDVKLSSLQTKIKL